MPTFYKAATANFFNTTLNGAINDSVNTITLNSTTNLQAPGFLIVDREDGNENATPSSREIIAFTGINGNDITGVTRGFDNSTARSHSDGALVEQTFVVGAWNDLRDAVATSLTTDGTGIALSGTASISRLRTTAVKNSLVTIGSSSSIDIDLDTGNIFTVAMPDSEMTVTVSNEDAGQVFLLDIVQRAQTSAPSITWPATVSWTDGTRPTLTSGSSKKDTLGFRVTGSNAYDGYVVGQNI